MAFGAASVLPLYSEPLLIYLAIERPDAIVLLWLVASAGNTAGAVLNWWLARHASRFQDRRWYPFKPKQWERAQGWFNKFGVWTLLLAWLPIGGDALTVVAGLMRVPLKIFIPLVALGKAARYAVVLWGTAHLWNI